MAATLDIVPLADLKAHLSVTTDADDGLLTAYMETARAFIEGWCGPLDDFEDGVPATLVHALKEYVRYLYDSRDPDKPALYEAPPAIFDLIQPHRQWSFGA
ncbi:head-tail connector protein [Xanthobacter sediminis]